MLQNFSPFKTCKSSRQKRISSGTKRPSKPCQKVVDGTSSKRPKKVPETNSATVGPEEPSDLTERLVRLETMVPSIKGLGAFEERVQGLEDNQERKHQEIADRVKGLEEQHIKNGLVVTEKNKDMDARVHCLEDKDSKHQQVAERVEQIVSQVQCLENKDRINQQIAERVKFLEDQNETQQRVAERVQCLEDENETHPNISERLQYLEGKDRTNQKMAARLQCLEDERETHQQQMAERLRYLEAQNATHQKIAERLQCLEGKDSTIQKMAARLECLQDEKETHQQMATRLECLEGRDRTNQQNEQNIVDRLDALEQKLVFAVDARSRLTRDTRERPETAAAATLLHPGNGISARRHSLRHAWREALPVQGNETTRNPCDTCSSNTSNMATRTKTPDAGVPNMTVQDRMNRLEATVLGSTMLYSAWILWNHWTR